MPLEILDKDAHDFSDEMKTLTENENSVLFYEKPGKILNQRLIF